jgi:hypothetical protein
MILNSRAITEGGVERFQWNNMVPAMTRYRMLVDIGGPSHFFFSNPANI